MCFKATQLSADVFRIAECNDYLALHAWMKKNNITSQLTYVDSYSVTLRVTSNLEWFLLGVVVVQAPKNKSTVEHLTYGAWVEPHNNQRA